MALAAADQLSRWQTEFPHNLSHELRTPLNVLIGYSCLGLTTRDPAKVHT